MKNEAEDFASARFALFNAKQKLRLQRARLRLEIENSRFDRFRRAPANGKVAHRSPSVKEVNTLLLAHDKETERLVRELERKHFAGFIKP
ncbi:MAG: hypothetical protein ACR2OR_01750 [Hyphomicrobiales bacterium]